jgi:hypothetical protein
MAIRNFGNAGQRNHRLSYGAHEDDSYHVRTRKRRHEVYQPEYTGIF